MDEENYEYDDIDEQLLNIYINLMNEFTPDYYK